ncbi:MAG: YajQ family cyclic di-GMP-binding protein [Pseudomonadota bacterium]
MPSFDVVSQVDQHELGNAIDQATRELGNRFDFRGVDASYAREGDAILLSAPGDFQLKQMLEILRARGTARRIDLRCLEEGEPEVGLARAKQRVVVRQGIEQALAKQILAAIRASKLKFDAQVNGDKLRVNGKKKDDLQSAITLLRGSDFERPLQFENFRD